MPAEFTDPSGRLWVDDAELAPDERVYRRIPPRWQDPQPDGSIHIASGAFDNDRNSEPMSVYLDSLLQVHELVPGDALVGHEGYGLAVLTVGALRTEEQVVAADPITDGDPPHPCDVAHAGVAGPKGSKRRRRLRNAAEWAVRPPD